MCNISTSLTMTTIRKSLNMNEALDTKIKEQKWSIILLLSFRDVKCDDFFLAFSNFWIFYKQDYLDTNVLSKVTYS
jgi:hypothetical protein